MDSTNIETGMSVIRNEAALTPIVGVVRDIYTSYRDNRSTLAHVEWQNSTRFNNGRTSTVSDINVTKLLIASEENIEAVKTKARKVTPMMMTMMGSWRECVGTEEYVRWDDIRERLGITWEQWWKGYEKACQKLIILGYLEPHQDNRNYDTGNRRYRMATSQSAHSLSWA